MYNASSEDSNQTANAQDDLNLRWAHMSEGPFSDVAAQFYFTLLQGLCSTALGFRNIQIDTVRCLRRGVSIVYHGYNNLHFASFG